MEFRQSILTLILILVLSTTMSVFGMDRQNIKEPNVSGQFYTADPTDLSSQIEEFISAAEVSPYDKHIDMIIAPHAGYMYSGGVAAYGFKAVSQNSYKTIVVLAPSHYVSFDGIAIWEKGGFKTPLGVVDVDEPFTAKLMASHEKFYFAPQAFEEEHSLEVEIPFLQKVFQDFKIVPVIMGQPTFEILEEFAKSLQKAIGDRKDVLIVVSTDLSHYHDDKKARQMDQGAIAAIKAMNIEKIWEEGHRKTIEMCGLVPVTAALLYAREKGLKHVDVLQYANSGDVTGDRDRVVGYTSIVIYNGGKSPLEEEGSSLTLAQKRRLVAIAKETINSYVRTGKAPEITETDPRLLKEEGTFVTIHKDGQLRGCIGNIFGKGPLCMLVRDMAISSATKDPRFPPVKETELDSLEIEVSVLSKPRVIKNVDEIQLGVHGVIVSQGPRYYGVFLPQVADETGWSKEKFLSELCSQKAGLSPDAWKDPKTKIEIFTAEVFSEKDVR